MAAKLQQELRDTAGFKSYGEVGLWLLALHDICVSYATAYRLAHDELPSKLKVSHPCSIKRDRETVKEFKRALGKKIRKAKALDDLKRVVRDFFLESRSPAAIQSLAGWNFILRSLSVTGL